MGSECGQVVIDLQSIARTHVYLYIPANVRVFILTRTLMVLFVYDIILSFALKSKVSLAPIQNSQQNRRDAVSRADPTQSNLHNHTMRQWIKVGS